jgi:hypothetical protein
MLSLGPPNYIMRETDESGLDREPPKANLSKGWWELLLTPQGV